MHEACAQVRAHPQVATLASHTHSTHAHLVHLHRNMKHPKSPVAKTGWKDGDIWQLQRSHDLLTYTNRLEKLRQDCPSAAEYLETSVLKDIHGKQDLTCFIRFAYNGLTPPRRTYGMRSNNLSEQGNGLPEIKKARDQSPFGALVSTVEYCETVLKQRQTDCEKMALACRNKTFEATQYTPFAENQLDNQMNLVSKCVIKRFNIHASVLTAVVYMPDSADQTEYTVSICNKSCTCGDWQEYELPCRHALKFYYDKLGDEAIMGKGCAWTWERFGLHAIAEGYLKQNYIDAYQNLQIKIPNMGSYLPDHDLKPSLKRRENKKGRKQTKRIATAGDNSSGGVKRVKGKGDGDHTGQGQWGAGRVRVVAEEILPATNSTAAASMLHRARSAPTEVLHPMYGPANWDDDQDAEAQRQQNNILDSSLPVRTPRDEGQEE